MGLWADLVGTTKSLLRIGIGGVALKNSSGNLLVRNTGDSADAEITASKANISGNDIVLNSDAAGAAADWLYTFRVPSSGMTAAVILTLPIDDGTSGQVLQTDGNGVLSWVSAGSTADLIHVNSTSFAYNTGSPIALFTLPANAVIHAVEIVIDTAFDTGTPTLSIGIAGTTSKYMGTSDVNLKGTAKDVYRTNPGEPAVGGTEDLIATLVPSTAGAGAGRVLVHYSTPA